MKTHGEQMAEIDKHLQIKFIDLQSFEKKARAEKGFLKKWEETKILDGVKEIRYFNYLIAELKHFQALSLNAPSELKRKTEEEIHAEFVAMESNLENKIKRGLERKLEKFIQTDSVLKILNEAKDFRDQILDRLCYEMDSFLVKWNALTMEQKHGFEAKQLDLNTFGEITKLLNLYRRLKNEKKSN
jgi:integrase